MPFTPGLEFYRSVAMSAFQCKGFALHGRSAAVRAAAAIPLSFSAFAGHWPVGLAAYAFAVSMHFAAGLAKQCGKAAACLMLGKAATFAAHFLSKFQFFGPLVSYSQKFRLYDDTASAAKCGLVTAVCCYRQA